MCSNGRSEEGTDSVGLQSEAAVSHPTGVMETKLESFGRAVNTFSGLAMGPALTGCILGCHFLRVLMDISMYVGKDSHPRAL